jgi:hypothetical protein
VTVWTAYDLSLGSLACFCEDGNEPSATIKDWLLTWAGGLKSASQDGLCSMDGYW